MSDGGVCPFAPDCRLCGGDQFHPGCRRRVGGTNAGPRGELARCALGGANAFFLACAASSRSSAWSAIRNLVPGCCGATPGRAVRINRRLAFRRDIGGDNERWSTRERRHGSIGDVHWRSPRLKTVLPRHRALPASNINVWQSRPVIGRDRGNVAPDADSGASMLSLVNSPYLPLCQRPLPGKRSTSP